LPIAAVEPFSFLGPEESCGRNRQAFSIGWCN
jgi:hypothetical protein